MPLPESFCTWEARCLRMGRIHEHIAEFSVLQLVLGLGEKIGKAQHRLELTDSYGPS